MPKQSFLKPVVRAVAGPFGAALAFVLLMPVTVSSAIAAPIGDGGFVYTANEMDNSLSRIDLATGEVETVPVPATPHNVQVTSDGTTLLAVGTPVGGEHEGDGAMEGMEGISEGLLLVFDTANFASGPTAEIEVGEHPAHVIADREGKYAFVTNSEDNNVSVVDLAAGTVVGTIPTGGFPHGFRMSPNGNEIYVANVEDDSVSVLDPATRVEAGTIAVGDAPVQVGFTPDGTRVYVSLRDEDKVAVIDTATRTAMGKVDVGDGPIQVYATPDGAFVLVANQGTEEEPSDTVSVIDVATNQVVQTIRTGAGAHGVAVNDNGQLAFITNIVDGTVSVIDIGTWAVIATIPVGAGPNGVTFGR